MPNALVWGYLHILIFAAWLGADFARFAVVAAIRNPQRSYETRMTLLEVAKKIHLVPRICFALLLPFGLELTVAKNVYPVNPELRMAFWLVAALWLAVIWAMTRYDKNPIELLLRYVEIFFEVLAGMAFVVYGLNSLATGAPIDDPWFAVKLFLFGLVFWTVVAVDLCQRPLGTLLAEIVQDGATPEHEETVSRVLNNTLIAMGALFVLLVAIAFVGKIKPF